MASSARGSASRTRCRSPRAASIPRLRCGSTRNRGSTFTPAPGGAIDKTWDLYADFAVIDRGDLSNSATRLPILDGGFDQTQIMFGVTHHFHEAAKREPLETE